MGLQGPSVSAVMSLNVSQPPTLLSGMSPRPQPPLQRIRRPMVGTVETREEVDCTLSHIKQLRQKEKQRKREAREARREHRKNMRELAAVFEGGLEDQAARTVWARDISAQQEEQRVSKVRRDIEDHRFFYTADTFFPFESKQGKPGIYDSPEVHREKLTRARARARTRARTLARARTRTRARARTRIRTLALALTLSRSTARSCSCKRRRTGGATRCG